MSAKPDVDTVARYLRRRRILRRVGFFFLIAILTSVVLGHFWQWRAGGDDWSRFDRHLFWVVEVPAGDMLVIAEPNGRRTTLRLLGIAAPESVSATQPAYWSAESQRALASRVAGKQILVRLPTLPVKSELGLSAYVYLPEVQKESLNEQLLSTGDVYADRRGTHPFHKQFDQAEMDARRKKKGLWKDVRDEQQPPWRRAWFETLRKQKEADEN